MCGGCSVNSSIATRVPPSSMAKITRAPNASTSSAMSPATSRLGVYRKSRSARITRQSLRPDEHPISRRYVSVKGSSVRCPRHPAGRRRVGAGAAVRPGRRWTVNKVLLTGRLTRDPEMRSLASGKNVTTFTVASNEFIGGGKEKAEYHPIVAWDRLAEIAGRYLGKGQQVAIEGRLQTRSWDDDKGARHWKTEIVANSVEMLSGRKKKDYAAESAADSIEGASGEVDVAGGGSAAAPPAPPRQPLPPEV